jgi:hypothetical protein
MTTGANGLTRGESFEDISTTVMGQAYEAATDGLIAGPPAIREIIAKRGRRAGLLSSAAASSMTAQAGAGEEMSGAARKGDDVK